MKQINKCIKNKLGSNDDLISNDLVDNTLTLSEQKEDLRKYIEPLMSMEDKLKDLIQSMPMGENMKSKQQIWKEIRGCW